MLRRLGVAVVVGILPVLLATVPARAAGGTAEAFLGKINSLRASVGAAPLSEDAALDSVAQRWADHMASTTTLAHNPSLSQQVSGNWTLLGENVGYGPTVDAIFNAFVASPHHYENLVDKAYNRVGIGVAVGSDGLIYTTHDFEAMPGGGTTASAPRTTVKSTTSRPTVAPKPKITVSVPQVSVPQPAAPAAQPAQAPPPPPPPAPEMSPRLALSLRMLQGRALGS
jgi:hypothetical protein